MASSMGVAHLWTLFFFGIVVGVHGATPASVIAYLKQITGQHTVSGQHNREPNSMPAKWTNKVHDITGVFPGMWEGDFLYMSDDIANRQTMVNMAKTQWEAGSLVGLMWHSCPPTMGEPCSWDDVKSKLTSEQWRNIVIQGTALNNAWKAKLDKIVPYLQQLQGAGIPVLWRPLHEINEGWSWWGGNGNSALLFKITHEYLTNSKGLKNLVWVWSVKDVDTSSVRNFYPGSQYVDVVALDVWNSGSASTEWYNTLQGIAAGKPIALAEVGALPRPAMLNAQPKWAYFSCWAEYLTGSNSNGDIKATYYLPRVLHRGDIHLRSSAM